MQQKVIIIGSGSTGLKAKQYLMEHTLQTNIEVISEDEANKRNIDVFHHLNHERAESAIEICKQYECKLKPNRRERRAKSRRNKRY